MLLMAKLRQRLVERQLETISEATQDVLTMQLTSFEPPLLDELAQTIGIDTAQPVTLSTIEEKINAQHSNNKEINRGLNHRIKKTSE